MKNHYKKAVVKFNDGVGALLCNRCSIILAYGLLHEDKQHFCEKCKEKILQKLDRP